MAEKITHLTFDALKSIVENKDGTTQYYVQILNVEAKSDIILKSGSMSQCTCSDGFAKMKMQILNLSPSTLASISKYKPIIKIQGLMMKSSFYIITKHEVIYLDKGPVGQPYEYDEYKQMNYTNPNGNTEIQFAKAPHTLSLNSNKKQSILLQQSKQTNENINSDQQQGKSAIKLSIQQKQQQSKPAIQKIEHQNQYPTSDQNLLKISELYPGMRGFKIKGRITTKTDITQFKSGKGNLFSIEIIDSEKSTIQGVFFNAQCDRFYKEIEIGKVYYFENGQVKTNRYSSKNQNQSEYQIHFEEASKISQALEDQQIDAFPFNITTIGDIDNLQLDDKCDVLGVITEVKPLTQITTKSGENKAKKNITIFDQTQRGIDIVLWGTQAEKWQFQKDEIVAFRGLKVTDYQAIRSLTVTNSTTYEKDISKLQKINKFLEFSQFYNENKDFIESKPKESKKKFALSYIEQIKKDFEGQRNNKLTKFYEIKAYITTIFSKSMFYTACENCKRKVTEVPQTKLYHCQNCNQNYPIPSYKYFFSAKIADTTGNLTVNVSNDQGQSILKLACEDFVKQNQREDIIKRATFQQFRFLIIAKMETYNDEIKPRFQVQSIIQDDVVSDNEELYNQIQQMLNIKTE
ncbi:unnamed protein product [Paramecium pentaurelia]|uniref:Replication protein A subunit n=1 Tax=Paramecium pentaurelia TaxID=43138 RepID=A0A8S1TF30_9CILI|nr:unnamed protein product [Paramecium pentaurelia]